MSKSRGAALAATLVLAAALAAPAPADAQRRRDREALEELETRVGVLERQIRADNLVALINAQDELRQEIRALRDIAERLHQDMQRNAELRRSQFAALEERLGVLEAVRMSPPAADSPGQEAGSPNAAPPDGASVSGTIAADSLRPQGEAQGEAAAGSQANYRQARDLLGEGQYAAAEAGFLRYLEANAPGRLAANARYWLGETYYVQGRYEEASAAFSRVASDFPDSSKVADALLKLGYTQDELGDTAAAVLTLERVRNDFPGVDAANLATLRLAQIEARSR